MVTNKLIKKIILISLIAVIYHLLSVVLALANVTLYNFESGTQGWVHQTYTDSQACTSVSQSSVQKYEGIYSLGMNMNLIGGHANNSKGEAYVDRGAGNLLNLQGIPFNSWVYCPTGSDGDPGNANGIQIFFKDSSWRSWYGPWNSIGNSLTWYDILLNTWTQLTVTLGTTTPAYVDSGFDATNILIIGIKMATGGGSTATYTGPVYADFVEYVDLVPPAPPTGVSIIDPGTGGTLNLSWTNPTDVDFNHIHIYRSTTNGQLGTLVYDNVTGISFQDTGLANNVMYYYTLRSVDNVGNESTNTDQYQGMPTEPSSIAVFYDFEDGTVQGWGLDAAVGLVNTTTRAKNGTRSIKFNVPTSGGVLGLGGQGYVEAFSDESPFPYRNLTEYSSISVWIYLVPGITIPVGNSITAMVTIRTSGGGYYKGDSTPLSLTSSNLGMWHKISFDIGLDGPVSVQYVTRMGVILEGGGGLSGNADLYIDFMEGNGDTTPPNPPTNISVTNPATGGTLNISWTNPTNNDFNHIHIYRSTTNGQLGILIYDNVTGISLSDTGLSNGQTYYYTVRSVDDSGNESTNTTQYSGMPTAGSGGVLYDFEDGTTQGWTNDTSIYYENNLGIPSNSSSLAHSGNRSLVYPLDLTDKGTNGIDDVGYIQPATPVNLTGYAGVTMYVYLPSDARVPPDYPVQGQAYVKTGSSWTWYNGTTQDINKGDWTRLRLDFSSSEYPAGSVANIDDIRELGVHIFGAAPGQGTTTIYLDTVEAGLGNDVTPPNPPSGLLVSDAGVGNKINLSWGANSESDLDYYKIYRLHSSGVLATKNLIANVNAGITSYSDTSVVNGINYYYQITAVDNSSNESNPSTENSAQPSGGSGLAFEIKGIQYTTWEPDYYSSVDSDASLDDLKSTGANYVGVLVTWYMDNKNSNTIYADASKTPTDASVIEAINDIHTRGMNVMLKPHIDCVNGDWRGYIDPLDKNIWFNEYNNFITRYAQIAQNNGVELFSIGTELKNMSKFEYLSNWTTIINNVRAIYSGPIVYAANGSGNKDEISTVSFWDQLDYGGVDIYFSLTDHTDPTLDELKRAWTNNKDGYNWVQIITNWYNYINKPIIITEIGYQSASGANITPWWVDSPTVNLTEQQNCYEAAFQVWNFKNWVKGVFWWDWSAYQNAGGPSDTNFTPQNKPAKDTLTSWYGGEEVRPFYDFEDGTTEGWINDTSADYIDNLSVPVNSTAYAKTGSRSIAYPLNLNNKIDGAINDAGYVNPIPAKDLSGYTGIRLYLYIPEGANIDPNTPLAATVYVKTGGQRDYFESNAVQYVFPGVPREISMDFSSSKDKNGQTGQVVTNTNKVREIGFHISGAETSSGTTTIYMDSVATGGEGDILGISIAPEIYEFGTVMPNVSSVSGTPVLIENSGNVNSNYYLQCSNSSPKGWTPSTTSPLLHQFVLNAQFNSVQPLDFVEANHALTTTSVICSGTKFAGDETGINVPPDGLRHLWFEFNSPLIDSAEDNEQQTIPVTITTEMAP